jgi:hypothetical protein
MEPRSLESRRTLSSLPGFLETDVSPRRARVLLDGEYVGQARDYDGRWDRLAAGAGSHTLEFSAPGYLTLRRTVDVGPSAVVRLSERLERGEGEDPRSTLDRSRPKASGVEKPSFLSIAVRPSDAAVYLDGIFLGLAEELERLHGASTVASGRHRLEAARPGYATRRVDFDVAGDEEPTRVEFELERLP